jgi:hypothetical protein
MILMVVGFNHNFRYRGQVYHIQTEDSGLKSTNIVTLLYHGGTILASKKTSYADIAKVDNLNKIVEDLMKEQHKEMLRSLKAGEFDAVLERYHSRRQEEPQPGPGEKTSPPLVARLQGASSRAATGPGVEPAATAQAPHPQPKPVPAAADKASHPETPVSKAPSPTVKQSLDDVILSYLFPDEDRK